MKIVIIAAATLGVLAAPAQAQDLAQAPCGAPDGSGPVLAGCARPTAIPATQAAFRLDIPVVRMRVASQRPGCDGPGRHRAEVQIASR